MTAQQSASPTVLTLHFRSKPLGAWKWARTRGYYRILRGPAGKDLRTPGVVEVFASGEVTIDYPGGRYGFAAERDRAERALAELQSAAN